MTKAPASGAPPCLVWFRQDLRLADNPALRAALAGGGPVIPVYVWAPEEEGGWAPGAAARAWLQASLTALDRSLREKGSRLVLRTGSSVEALRGLVEASGARTIHWNRRYEPAARERDAAVKRTMAGLGVEVHEHNASLLFEPGELRTKAGDPFRVFTPFLRACLAGPEPASPASAPAVIAGPARRPPSGSVKDLALTPGASATSKILAAWQPGEAGAQERLQRFLGHGLAGYEDRRNRPDEDGTSRLSPHLRHGETSPRQVWHAVRRAASLRRAPGLFRGGEAYLRQVVWREFAYHLLYNFPQTAGRPLRPEFERFPWSRGATFLEPWQSGLTGYPLVDAGMRELKATGWMHNRARMVAASFLVKDLLLPWQTGARWFWETLVDADLANNTLGWQWVAGCGADAAPYFRIFNPALQAERYDPVGTYARQWIPELTRLPEAAGRAYPRPVVDHEQARLRALAALARMRKRSS